MSIETIHEDLAAVLEDWAQGKEIRSVELGHTQRMIPHPGEADRIDLSHVHRVRQALAHEWAFLILEHCAQNGLPVSFEEYAALCDELEANHMDEVGKLSKEELDGAESLAWKALLHGWKNAIHGHEERKYITVKRA